LNLAQRFATLFRPKMQQSLAVDPNYARSYVMLAHTYTSAWSNALDSDFLNPAALEQAHQFARKALQLDPNLPRAHAALALIFMWKHRHDASIAEVERAITLNPNHVDWRFGWPLVLAGQPRRAIEVIEAHMRLDPFYLAAALAILGLAHYVLKQYSQALTVLRNHGTRAPNSRYGHAFLAATLAQLGQIDEARAEAAEVLRLQPGYTIAGTARRLFAFKSREDDEHFSDGLRKAGLPE
jgi:adenylate cyclase